MNAVEPMSVPSAPDPGRRSPIGGWLDGTGFDNILPFSPDRNEIRTKFNELMSLIFNTQIHEMLKRVLEIAEIDYDNLIPIVTKMKELTNQISLYYPTILMESLKNTLETSQDHITSIQPTEFIIEVGAQEHRRLTVTISNYLTIGKATIRSNRNIKKIYLEGVSSYISISASSHTISGAPIGSGWFYLDNLMISGLGRNISIWIEDLIPNEPLYPGTDYYLSAQIKKRGHDAISQHELGSQDNYNSERANYRILLTIHNIDDLTVIDPPVRTLTLYTDHDSDVTSFRIRAKNEGLYHILMNFYYDKNLLKTLSVPLRFENSARKTISHVPYPPDLSPHSQISKKILLSNELFATDVGFDSIMQVLRYPHD